MEKLRDSKSNWQGPGCLRNCHSMESALLQKKTTAMVRSLTMAWALTTEEKAQGCLLTRCSDKGLSGFPPLTSLCYSASRAPHPSVLLGPAAIPGAGPRRLQTPYPLVPLLQGLYPSRSGQWECSRRVGS